MKVLLHTGTSGREPVQPEKRILINYTASEKIPVILDTDIGGDIDDTWALAMLLKSPELDLKLVSTDTEDTIYRAKIVAKLLEIAGRTDVNIAVGIPNIGHPSIKPQIEWVEDYDLARYPGDVLHDGVQAIINTVMNSAKPITLICIGPVTNIADALRREPRIAERIRFVGMHGSFNWGITSNLKLAMKPGRVVEWNVFCDVAAAQTVFSAPWQQATITPMDTCARVVLEGEHYRRLQDSKDLVVKAVLENYRIWSKAHDGKAQPDKHTSVLFDCVAVHLAYTTRWLKMQPMGVRIDDEGYTLESSSAREFNVALEWDDYDAFAADLVARLLS